MRLDEDSPVVRLEGGWCINPRMTMMMMTKMKIYLFIYYDDDNDNSDDVNVNNLFASKHK